MSRDWIRFNEGVVAEFRANDGTVEYFGELPLVIVHTIGSRSGVVRLTPLIPVFAHRETYLFATKAGAPEHPAWYHNLRAHPHVTIEHALAGSVTTVEVDTELLGSEAAERVVAERAASTPQLAEYVADAAPRKIPVFRVTPSLA